MMDKSEWIAMWKLSPEEGDRLWEIKMGQQDNPIEAPMLVSEERNYKAYKSMATGEMIEGRKAHREHLKRNNLVEIGNETLKPKPKELPGGLKERIWEVARSKGF